MRATPARPLTRFLLIVLAVVACLAVPMAQTQRPDAATLRAEVAALQQTERSLRDLQSELQSYLSSDVVLLINPYGIGGATIPIPLSRFKDIVTKWALLGRQGGVHSQDTVSRQVALAIAVSNELKTQIREGALPEIERDLSAIRQKQNQIGQQLSVVERPVAPGQIQTPPPTDAGEGWVLERALSGLNDGARAQVLSQSATAAGGDVTLRYQVTATCSETWHMSWTFSPDLRFVYQGTRIRTTLTTELVGRGCNYRVGSYLAIGEGTTMERFVNEQVPPDRQESRVIESENLPRAQASSGDPVTSTTTTGELIVRRQPVRWPSYTVLRMYAYVPGTTLTIAYVFRAN